MSEQENMVRAWSMTLMPVLTGYTLATAAMVLAGEEKKIIEVSMEVMREMMDGYTPEQKQLLSKQLDLLCRLANES